MTQAEEDSTTVPNNMELQVTILFSVIKEYIHQLAYITKITQHRVIILYGS